MGLTNNLGKLSNMITSTGSAVGIAQSSPSYTLDVTGTGRFTGALTAQSGTITGANDAFVDYNRSAIDYANGIRLQTAGSNNWLIGNAGTNDLLFYNYSLGSAPLRITAAGNVGIGTTTPNKNSVGRALTVNASSGNSMYELTTGDSSTTAYWEYTGTNSSIINVANGFLRFGTNNSERMRITSGGSVCIGRTSAPNSAYKMAVQEAIMMAVSTNTNNMVNFFNQSDTYVASITVNASTVAYGTGSDYRLKEDLKDFNGLDKISAIKVYDFKFKAEGDRMEGVIAHELQEIIPYAVTGVKDEKNKDGSDKIQNVDYSKLVPILVKSIQELEARLKTLENK